jgi:hypothetical protein
MGWSDYLPNWDYGGLALRPIYKALLAITKAVNERCLAARTQTITEEPSQLDNLSIIPILNTKIKRLITSFVNHTVNGGNFKETNEMPMWTESEIKNYGKRADGSTKGLGYFGEIYGPNGDFSTEISINYNGREIPTLVPTLTDDEVKLLLAGGEIPQTIIDKADAYATARENAGKSPFAEDGEQYPRSWMPTLISPLVSPWFWIYQQYQIINKLLWCRYGLQGSSDYIEYKRAYGTGFDQLMTNFQAAEWIAGGWIEDSFYNNGSLIHANRHYLDLTSFPDNLNFKANIYAYPVPTMNDYFWPIPPFDEEWILTEYPIQSGNIINKQAVDSKLCLEDSFYNSAQEMEYWWNRGISFLRQSGGVYRQGSDIVLKFDVPGGFEFLTNS